VAVAKNRNDPPHRSLERSLLNLLVSACNGAKMSALLSVRGTIMDELIARLVNNLGIDRNAAEKAVGIILEFLKKEGPPDKVQALLDQLPGAAELMEAQEGIDASGGGMFAMGGIMGAGTKMMAAGLTMPQVQGVARETLAFAREKAGEDTIGEIVGAIPGLSQFV
jgi:hypothetical protein